jgi:hypothetical protein
VGQLFLGVGEPVGGQRCVGQNEEAKDGNDGRGDALDNKEPILLDERK